MGLPGESVTFLAKIPENRTFEAFITTSLTTDLALKSLLGLNPIPNKVSSLVILTFGC